jgi:hypothetical protein
VGSQYKAGSIQEALVDNASDPERDRDDSGETPFAYQSGLRPNADWYLPLQPGGAQSPTDSPTTMNGQELPAHGSNQSHLDIPLTPLRLRVPPSIASDRDEDHGLKTGSLDCKLPPPTWWSFDVRGDERREGPIFNYARVFTWFAFAGHIERGLETALESFCARAAIPSTTKEAADRCGFHPYQDLVAFTAWSDLPHVAIRRMCMAGIVALLLQWGTTGAAIFVAYNTPPVGIGCRSGSYLIYGIAATVSWLLLVFSNVVSHALMQRLERDPSRQPGILGGLAVTTRLMGKAIAISNAGWLIASTVMEDIGFFQTCWCQTSAFQFGQNGWATVFKGPSDLRDVAGGIWIGGFIWSAAVCVITAAIFAYGPH